MSVFVDLFVVLIGLFFSLGFLGLVMRITTHRDRGGNSSEGLAIMAGGLRWFGVRWGARTIPAGLRQSGFSGRFVFWPWHSGFEGVLAIPALINAGRTEKRAARLAGFITRRYRKLPDRPIYLFGISAGGFVVLRAIEMLPGDVRIHSAALLSAAIDPNRDLGPALSHIDHTLTDSYSYLDFVILGFGTAIFGTADRKHTASAGMVGLRHNGEEKIVDVPWHPAMILTGRLGGHTSCSPPAYLSRYILPLMGIGKGDIKQ